MLKNNVEQKSYLETFQKVIEEANHPTQILKLEIPFEVHENDMIRVVNHED